MDGNAYRSRVSKWHTPALTLSAFLLNSVALLADAAPIDPSDQPTVERATLQKLARATDLGNALLDVRFSKVERPLEEVLLYLDDQKVALRDDGVEPDKLARDGVYSAVMKFDFAQFETDQQRRARLAREFGGLTPIFVGRTQTTFARVQTYPKVDDASLVDLNAAFKGLPYAVSPSKTLLIKHSGVVDDLTRTNDPCNGGNANGPWSFGYLMTQMANEPVTGISVSQFVSDWLSNWASDVTINGQVSTADLRLKAKIIDRWVAASGGPGHPLDMSKAPFRLLAIVNRIDLRSNPIYGGGNAGETRFVFGGVDLNHCAHNSVQLLPLTVIFEYGINAANCKGMRSWAQQWLALNSLTLGSPAYNAALQAMTDTFTVAGAAPTKPNQSALNQLRTDHETSEAREWELREFRIRPMKGSSHGPLLQVVTKQTPADNLDFTSVIADYINAHETAIVHDRYVVPLTYPGTTPFLAAASRSRGVVSPERYWDGPSVSPGPDINNPEARFHFSLNTCNGCHVPETGTPFLHIKNRMPGNESLLSQFLTGIDVDDPADGAPTRHFNDLARRAQDLDTAANASCLAQLFAPEMRFTH